MKKILVADDTKNIRNLLSTCLEIEGYEVISATNGEEALNLFEHQLFDLAFLDIKMPKLSGTEVLRRIRNNGINTPVIIMTAFATIKNAVECTKLGAVCYLQKPFTTDKIKKVLDEIQLFNTNDTVENQIYTIKKLIENNRLDESLEFLKKCLSLNPSYKEIYHLLSIVYDKKGDEENSHTFFKIYEQFK